ncbi:helix-turn-helix transcriptional regulator [Streptomyces physcomitrii]|uniref:Helix-turn-helix transcriptional regulator n=1 Tax=Streptomyces physcomitrii TaxID=2724184 RepID=A0ABX1H059_9ACTN|nr:LuxR C-terminal-related transcriptional regulator [Streptomyces physcomitrii]NKI41739.1 helix-turn-helix transcriptional regulator [Streptomyces physcomitrii]
MTHEHPPHPVEKLCEAGLRVYAQALREGHVAVEDAEAAPCLTRFGLLHPDFEDSRWLKPAPPAVLLPRLLRGIEDEVARHRRRERELAEIFEPLMALDADRSPAAQSSALTVLSGTGPINAAIQHVMAEATQEILTIQPGGARSAAALAESYAQEQAMLDRGARMRTLYQHTTRYAHAVLDHFGRLRGDVEARTLSEVTDRLVVIDRSVAFIPANAERTLALEIRHPSVIAYLTTTFERQWNLATPLFPTAAQQPQENGVTARQRAIAALLVEGETDARIAERLGMNVRTCRAHIAKLAATLGSANRAQLGFLIGRSQILDQEQ